MLQHPTRIFKFKYALLIVLCMEPKQNLAAAKKNKGRSEVPVPPIENHFERNTWQVRVQQLHDSLDGQDLYLS